MIDVLGFGPAPDRQPHAVVALAQRMLGQIGGAGSPPLGVISPLGGGCATGVILPLSL